MKNKHLTDLNIQKFAFDKNECESYIKTHILTCTACKKRVEIYLSLSSDIKATLEPSLDYNLSKLVLDQLPINNETETSAVHFISFITLTMVVLFIWSIFLSGDTIKYLLDNAFIQQSYFFAGIIILISIVLVLDQLRSFNNKKKKLFLN